MNQLPWALFSLIAFAMTTFVPAHSARAADEEQSKLNLDFRYRYEFVDQDGIDKNAYASTLRTRLAYRSAYTANFGFLIEFDDLRPIGNDLYNSTRNGNLNRPVVADPKGTIVNQALILFRGIEKVVSNENNKNCEKNHRAQKPKHFKCTLKERRLYFLVP